MWSVQTRDDTGGNVFDVVVVLRVFDVVGVLRVFDVGVVELRVQGVYLIIISSRPGSPPPRCWCC